MDCLIQWTFTIGSLLQNAGSKHHRLRDALAKEADECLPIGGTKLLSACSEVAVESGGRVYLWGGFCGEPTKNLRCLTMVCGIKFIGNCVRAFYKS